MAFHDKFEIDKETGFLTPKKDAKIRNGFTASQKTEYLKIFRASANSGKACKAVGIDRHTVLNHVKGDQKFALEKQKVIEDICDDMEQCLFELAKRNPTAAFGILKAYRASIWKDNYQPKGPTKDERLKGLIDTLKDEDNKNG